MTLGMAALFAGGLSAQDHDAMVARGKYLVEGVAMCQDCHTPKLESGEADTTKWLKGGMLTIAPTTERPGWHKAAPDLTSTSRLFARWGDEGLTNFLMTGKNPRGGSAGPPMPQYRMSQEDAAAVVAYLKTLP